MDILVLRLIHIGAGVFWVGAVFAFFLFVQPAAMAVGPDATKFNYRLLHHHRFAEALLAAGATTIIAGILLLALTSNGFDPDLLFDASRLGYTVGGVVALIAFTIGAGYVFPRTKTVERTLGTVLAEGRPPTPDEQQLLARTAQEARRAGWLVLIGLALAVVAMATARLWGLVL
jgi:uncharacterized membrane protein